MIVRPLCIAAMAGALLAAPASAVMAQSGQGAQAHVAAALIPRYASANDSAKVRLLFGLQLAAGRYNEADASLDRLEAMARETSPKLPDMQKPWRIYTRAMRHEGQGASPQSALARAFAEVYGALPDTEAAEVLPWYGADLDALRGTAARSFKACDGQSLDACPGAAQLIADEAALKAWTYLMPASTPLIRADAERRFFIDDQLLAPTPDGVQIAVMTIRPRSGPARVTSLMNFTIYAKDDWSFADAFKLAAHGYAGVVAYSRGKGRSTGAITPYVHDGQDADTVIDWLARQGWSDSRVGMFSGSYNSFTQWAAVKHRPAALKAIATNASNAPGVDTPMQGNVFQSFSYPWPFYTTDTKVGLDDKVEDDYARWDRMEREWYRSGRPYRDMDRIDGTPNPVWDEWLKHPGYDDYWRRLIPVGREFADVDIPVFVETGYYDGGMVGALHYFEQHTGRRPSADHRMLIGPYHHTAMQQGVMANIRGYMLDRAALVDLQDIRQKWFDHVFKGAPLPEILSDRVNFEVMGADQWRHAPSLDGMGTSRLRLYLGGGSDQKQLPFTVRAPDAAPPALRVDFADRSDLDYQPPFGNIDTRNALVFTTPPNDRPMEVDGLFRGHFQVVTNKRDFDLDVSLFEQGPQGNLLLGHYLGRVSYMKDRTHRRLLQSGQAQILDFESQTVAGRLMPAGSRLVAVVAVPKRPELQINYGTGRDVSDESIADAKTPLSVRFAVGSYLDFGIRR